MASSNITSWKDPAFKGNLKKVLVVALMKDFEYRLSYETEIVNMLNKAGINAEISMNLFGVEKKLTKDELINILEKGKFDALLAVKYTGSKSYNSFVPSLSFYNWYWGGYDNMYSSGYYEKHTLVNTEAILYSESSESAVWFASLETTNAYNRQDLTSSLASKIANNLLENDIIKYQK